MRLKILERSVLIICGAALLFVFQNCSPKQFEQVSSDPSQKSACAEDDDDCVAMNEPPTPQIPDTTPETVEPPQAGDDQVAIASCEEAIAKSLEAVELAEGGKIHKHHGNIFARVSHLKMVHKSEAGLMVFVPGSDDAFIRKIMHYRGDLLLCGVDVGKIMHMQGKLTAVDLKIGKVMHLKGEINLDNVSIQLLKHNELSN